MVNAPEKGTPLPLKGDARFPAADGWQKMQATHEQSDGSIIVIHYQYNSNTGKAYDMKFDSPKTSELQPSTSYVAPKIDVDLKSTSADLPPKINTSNITEAITDPGRLVANPARNPRTGELDPNYKPPEASSDQVQSYLAPEGMKVNMAVHKRQIDPKTGQVDPEKIGGFTTKDNITSVEQVHSDLAVKTPDWGPAKTHVQEFEIKSGTRIQESKVGEQIGSDGKVYNGGGNQVEPLVPASQRSEILIPIGPARPLPKFKSDLNE